MLAAPANAATHAANPLTKVKVDGAPGAKPTVTFTKPFKVTTSVHQELTPGTGQRIGQGSNVAVDYVIVDGRTGSELDTSFGKQVLTLALDQKQTPTYLVTAFIGSAVGSRVLVAVAPKEGLAKKNATAGIQKNDTLLMVFDVKSLRSPLARATGTVVTPAPGLPAVTLGAKGKPKITVPKATAPAALVVQPLIQGTGPIVASGQSVTLHYTGVIWASGKQFDSSWDRGAPASFTIGQNIPGFDAGLVGQHVGSQLLLVIPPAQGYGASGNSGAGISGTDTLVFVVDILDAY
jgi:peptidylprolyl isomerase